MGAGEHDGDAHDEVRRTAALARIELTEEEVRRLAPQFARILQAFGSLAEVEVTGDGARAPASPAAPTPGRPDVVQSTVDPERLLALAPERIDAFFGVPKTVDSGPAPEDRP